MKKKLLSLLLSMAMVLSLLPVSALATGDVTVTTFDELKNAIADATDGDTITVQGKIEVIESLVIDNNPLIKASAIPVDRNSCDDLHRCDHDAALGKKGGLKAHGEQAL